MRNRISQFVEGATLDHLSQGLETGPLLKSLIEVSSSAQTAHSTASSPSCKPSQFIAHCTSRILDPWTSSLLMRHSLFTSACHHRSSQSQLPLHKQFRRLRQAISTIITKTTTRASIEEILEISNTTLSSSKQFSICDRHAYCWHTITTRAALSRCNNI